MACFWILEVWTLIAFHPIVMLNNKYKNEIIIGKGNPLVWISSEDAMHQNINIKYHLPKAAW